MQKRFQTLQYCAFQKLNFLAEFFPLLLPIYTNTFFSKDKGDSLYWMENFNSSFGYFSAVHGRSWPCHSWHQNKSSLSKASNILMALLTSSCACYNSSQWTLRHGLLKKFIELSRECFCVPHLTTFWDTMNPTRHERHISHLEGDCRSGGWCWAWVGAGKAKEQQIQAPSHRPALPAPSRVPHKNRGALVHQTTLLQGQRVPEGSFSQNQNFAHHVATIITKTHSCSH